MTPSSMAIMLCMTPVDLRGSFDGLARAATEFLGANANSTRAMFVFVNKHRNMAKVLWRDGTGWCILAKRLDTRFIELPLGEGDKGRTIDARALAVLLDGVAGPKPTTRGMKPSTRDIVKEARLAAERVVARSQSSIDVLYNGHGGVARQQLATG